MNQDLVPLTLFSNPIGVDISILAFEYVDNFKYLPLFDGVYISNFGWSVREPEQQGQFKGLGFLNDILSRSYGKKIFGGHVIYAGGYPNWVKKLDRTKLTYEDVEQIIKQRIEFCVGRYPQVKIWTVLNEFKAPWFDQDPLYDIFKEKFIQRFGSLGAQEEEIETAYFALIFNTAKEINPNPVLVYSDATNQFKSKPGRHSRYERNLELMNRMLNRGVKIDAIGIHAHLNSVPNNWIPQPNEFEEIVRSFRSLGIDVHVNELDVSVADLSRYGIPYQERYLFQAKTYHEFIGAAIRAGVNYINFWGGYKTEIPG